MVTISVLFLSSKKTPLESEKVGEDSDMEHLSQRNIDRFGVLLDLWASEAQYLQAKMKVTTCVTLKIQYLESASLFLTLSIFNPL